MNNNRPKNNIKEAIAIVGMGCRYPGNVNSPKEFWEKLKEGFDGIIDVPEDRWDREDMFHPDSNTTGKISVKRGGFIKNIDLFDAGFFGISPIEAIRMDPQQRMLLEVTYQAIEDAGTRLEDLSDSRTGVFVGISSRDYSDIQSSSTERMNIGANTNTGGAASIASNRISYIFNLKGPSFSVDTACSSSLTAIHLACRSIWSGESHMAFAGGANAILKPEPEIGFSKGGFLSEDGYCKSFDFRANGYVRSEGAGMIFLKKLSQAKADGDDIYATIIGSAINQDGRTSGITVPSGESQIKMLQTAIADAGIESKQISYIEAHGTGTPVGDPIETKSIGVVINEGRDEEEICFIGSVKSNIGHLEPASGIAGISKLILSLKNEQIPPNLHFVKPNPDIPFEKFNLKVPTKIINWKQNNKPRYAGVNSFGFGGANAHVVLQGISSYKSTTHKSIDDHRHQLFVLSARSKNSLYSLAKSYIKFLTTTEYSLTDICYNSGARRSAHDHKLTIATVSKDDLIEKLKSFLKDENYTGMSCGKTSLNKKPKVAFVFSGQGPQWFAMGRELIQNEPIFRNTILEIDKLLSKFTSWSLLEELDRNEKESRISETRIAQPAIMAIQIALTKLWESYGVTPEGVVGHSIGEVAAAYVAGAITLEQAVTVIFHRSRGQGKASGKGKMLAVGLTLSEAKAEIRKIENKVSIATINGPKSVVFSGNSEELEKISERLESKDIFNRFLHIDIPFHSHYMEPLRKELTISLEHIRGKQSEIPLYSTVTAQQESGEHLNSEYWYRNVREPVYFINAAEEMMKDGFNLFIEISPHPILSIGLKEMFSNYSYNGVVIPSIRRNQPEKLVFIESLGQLYINSYPLQWEKLFTKKIPIKLPFYSWEKESYWLESEQTKKLRLGSFKHPHLTRSVQSAREEHNILWDIDLDKRKDPYINDHKLQGPIVYPGAGHVELALSCAIESFGKEFNFLKNIHLRSALFLPDDGPPPEIQIDISSHNGDYFIYTRPRDSETQWLLCSEGKINHSGDQFQSNPVDFINIQKSLISHSNEINIKHLHNNLFDAGLELGPSFKALKKLWAKDMEVIAEIEVPDSIRYGFDKFNLHPSILDSSFQALFGIYFKNLLPDEKMGVYIPIHFNRIKFFQKPGMKLWVYGKQLWLNESYSFCDLWIFDNNENLVAEIQGFKSQYLKGSRGKNNNDIDNFLYEYSWNLRQLEDEKSKRKPDKYLAENYSLKTSMENHVKKVIRRNINKEYENEFLEKIDKLVCYYIIHGLGKLGIEIKEGEELKPLTLINSVKIISKQQRLFEHLFKILSDYNYLEEKNKLYKVIRCPTKIDIHELQKDLEKIHPNFNSEIALLGRCAIRLAEVLIGDTDPVQFIFSNDQWDSIIQFYTESYSSKKYNELLTIAIEKLIEELPDDQTLRILEIGGGTGGATQAILPILPAKNTEYYFTDISSEFLERARNQFLKYPFVKYQIFNLENNPCSQGIIENSFDLVIASNVVHATTNISNSLSQIKKILAPQGRLLLLEVIRNPIYFDLIFGLMEGVWLFNDTDLRPDHAIMDASRWKEALIDAGFIDYLCVTDQTTKTTPAQAIIVAKNKLNQKSIDKEIKIQPIEQGLPGGNWLVFANNPQLINGIKSRLSKEGKTVFAVKKGDKYTTNGSEITISSTNNNDFKRLISQLDSSDKPLEGIVYAWSDLAPKNESVTAKSLKKMQLDICMPLYGLLNALDRSDMKSKPKFYAITFGAQNIKNETVSISQSPLWGLLRAYYNERPKIKIALIDLAKIPTDSELDNLIREFNTKEWTQEVGFRSKGRYVHKLDNTPLSLIEERAGIELPASGGNYHTTITEYGLFDNLKLEEKYVEELLDNQIEIDVKASALNFRDIMVAMGLLSDDAIEGGLAGRNFGLECSGVVVRIGAKISKFKVGDEVLALAKDTLGGKVICLENHALSKPNKLSFEEAATLPAVYLTAYYALVNQCRIQPGERVLIHAASGGVGIAAINIAKQIGAEIFATAGSPEKHEFLRKLGVKHILNSRTLRFADEIRNLTEGKGVDIILNSLSGKAISQSIKCLAPYGRFVEIGKTDIYRDSKIGLQPFGDNLSYFGVDIDRMLSQKPEFSGRLFEESIDYFIDNGFNPHPYKEFPISKVNDAFMFMSQAKHIGKVVITMKEPKIRVSRNEKYRFRPDASYLITGGASGFGLAVSAWMAKQGVKHLILVSRTGPKNVYDEFLLSEIEKQGTKVYFEKADITSEVDVQDLFKRIQSLPTLKGVIHAASVFKDTPVEKMDAESFTYVMDPKMLGGWALHKETQDLHIDFFINFGSISGVYGSPGQSNYTAANVFLDMLSHYRRSLGLPCSTIDWGAIGGVGFVAREEKIKNILSSQGWHSFSQRDVQVIMNLVLVTNPTQKIAVSADWKVVGEFFQTASTDTRMKHLFSLGMSGKTTTPDNSLKMRILSLDDPDKIDLITTELRNAIARILGSSASKVDITNSITKMGLDSLMANQLRNWIQSKLDIEYSMMKIMKGPSVQELSEQLLAEIFSEDIDKESEPEKSDFDKWIIRNREISNPRIRLFCFPYFAGGASIYNTWHNDISNDIEVCAIQLPGREERSSEKAISNMDELLDQLIQLVEPLLDRPYAIYAHSMGSGLAYEFVRRIRKEKRINPIHFFLSAWQAPQLPTIFSKLSNISDEDWPKIPDKDIIDEVGGSVIPKEVLENKELVRELMPSMRADIWMFGKEYNYKEEEKLSSPITAFWGTNDHVFQENKVRSWSEHSNKFTFRKIEDGDHLFIRSRKSEVITYINEHLHEEDTTADC